MTTRNDVYRAIDTERWYQDHLKKDRTATPTDGTRSVEHSVGDFITMLSFYLREAQTAWTANPGDAPALNTVRKIAAIAVNCIEQHGAPRRAQPAQVKGEQFPPRVFE